MAKRRKKINIVKVCACPVKSAEGGHFTGVGLPAPLAQLNAKPI
jgi:hypothetical protein